MQVTVLYFAAAREIAGCERESRELPGGATLAELRSQLAASHAGLEQLPFVFAVNEDYADSARVLSEGDEVALIPAISGG